MSGVDEAIARYLASNPDTNNIVVPAKSKTVASASKGRWTARPRFNGKGTTKFGRFTPGKGLLS